MLCELKNRITFDVRSIPYKRDRCNSPVLPAIIYAHLLLSFTVPFFNCNSLLQTVNSLAQASLSNKVSSSTASMVRQVMPEFKAKKNVIILCDSWYVKKDLAAIVDDYENLDLIGNARSDSVLYDLPPAPTGRKGRPPKHGRRLSIYEDFTLSAEKIGDYYTGCRRVLTNIFGSRQVLAYVTSTGKGGGTRRLLFSTIFPAQLQIFCAWQEKSPLNRTGSSWMQYIPLLLYSFRWNIEVSYYEQKTFWSLCGYMVRSRKGIEMMVNLVNISYCAMKILPYRERGFSQYKNVSVQEFRFAFSEQIRRQVFYVNLM